MIVFVDLWKLQNGTRSMGTDLGALEASSYERP
jgi:hypothetical protein